MKIKVAIYKDGKREFEEIDYDLYKSMLQQVKKGTISISNKNEIKVNVDINKQCCFKLFISCIKNRFKKWKIWGLK